MWPAVGGYAWCGLLTSLMGLVGSGGIVWAVRLIGRAALRRGSDGLWRRDADDDDRHVSGLAGVSDRVFSRAVCGAVVGIAQLVLRRDDVIPFGPFLCLGAAAVVVDWAPIWMWAGQLFAAGPLVPAVLAVCLVLLGLMLALWRVIKGVCFGAARADSKLYLPRSSA